MFTLIPIKHHSPSLMQMSRRFIAALYLTGDKAKENYAVLKPYLDFNEKFRDRKKLEENITNRKMKMDMDHMFQQWEMYRDMGLKKKRLELRRAEISDLMRRLDSDENTDLKRKYQNEGRIVREDLKLLRESSYALEESFIGEYLSLPNSLHKRTPMDTAAKTFSYLNRKKDEHHKSHLLNSDNLEFYDESCYFLKNDGAKFDLLYPLYVSQKLKKLGYIQFSNPDFVRTVIAEAAGCKLSELFLIDEKDESERINLLHLAGSASLLSFIAYIVKLSIYPNVLPLKLYSTGRQYILDHKTSDDNIQGLYASCQSNALQMFLVTDSQENADVLFDEAVNNVIEFYKPLNRHFRVVYVPAHVLYPAESLRSSFQLYSSLLDRYIEVGQLSQYGDYISKRVLFNLKGDKPNKFPFIISGTAVNTAKILASSLEQQFELPTFLVEHFNLDQSSGDTDQKVEKA